jgi:dolichyl-phosphate beta-glucosyltransferase
MGDFNPNLLLSIIIPAYNEEKRLPSTLQKITEFLRKQTYTAELIIVENGSTDKTSEAVLRFCEEAVSSNDPFRVHLLHSPKGKGAAVKHGMLQAQGKYLIMTDADLAVPIEEVNKFLPSMLTSPRNRIAIASRELPEAVRYGEPIHRHLMGRIFNFFVRLLVAPQFKDTQCGFKCFSQDAAQLLFPLQRVHGWGFDVEILYIAARYGLNVIELPVHWRYGAQSRVQPMRDTLDMLIELMRIRLNSWRGYYDPQPVQSDVDKLPVT